jgi:hypothetical protein
LKQQSILIGIVILLICAGLSGCFQTTQSKREKIDALTLSSDGKTLLCITSEQTYNKTAGSFNYSLYRFIWYSYNGTLIQNKQLKNGYYYQFSQISPNGLYCVNDANKTILSVYNGSVIAHYFGKYQKWAENNEFFITTDNGRMIYFWNVTNFTMIKTISVNNRIFSASISPNGTLLAIEDKDNVSIIDITNGNSTLWMMPIKYLHSYSWSKDEKTIQIIERDNTQPSGYNLRIRNSTDGKVISSISSTFNNGQHTYSQWIFSTYGQYVVYDLQNSTLRFFTLEGLQRLVNHTGSEFSRVLWSSDKSTMTIYELDEGTIEILNASTGDIIHTLETPIYEYNDPPYPNVNYFIYILSVLVILIFIIIIVIIIAIWHQRKNRNNKP